MGASQRNRGVRLLHYVRGYRMSMVSEHHVSAETNLRADNDVHACASTGYQNIAHLEQAVAAAGRAVQRPRYALTSATTVSPRVARKWVRQMQRPGETTRRTAENVFFYVLPVMPAAMCPQVITYQVRYNLRKMKLSCVAACQCLRTCQLFHFGSRALDYRFRSRKLPVCA